MAYYKNALFIVSLIFAYGCRTLAQKPALDSASTKFNDPDIETFSPTFESPKEKDDTKDATAFPKKDCKTLPSSKTARLKLISDSITATNRLIKFTSGYRILVYSGTDRDEANRAKGNLYQLLPNADLYVIYKQPDYRVKMGDYADRLEAYRVLKLDVARAYPNAIVIQDNIYIKRK